MRSSRARTFVIALTIAGVMAIVGSSVTLASGAAMLKDIRQGSGTSEPRDWATVNGHTLFSADDSVHGLELWVTNGSRSGTRLLKDVNPSGSGSNASGFMMLSSSLALVPLDDGVHGQELWRTDGTPSGTQPVKDIRLGHLGSNIVSWRSPIRGLAFFFADDGPHGRELWRSDGTKAGTFLLRDIQPGQVGQAPATVVWAAGGYAWLNASDPNHGRELWRSDGTSTGTKRIADLNPGPADSNPTAPTMMNGDAYFTADDGTHGYALRRTTGPGNVQMVKDIYPQPSGPNDYSSNITNLTGAGGLIYFVGYSGSTDGPQLWETDGTSNGTHVVRFIGAGPNGALPYFLTPYKNRLYFVARPGTTEGGTSLWRTDGLMEDTVEVKVLSNRMQAVPNCTLRHGGARLFFVVDSNDYGKELWTSDGTTEGTRRLTDTNPGQADGALACPMLAGKYAYSFAYGSGGVPEWWRSDGTLAGTVRLARFSGFASVSDPEYVHAGFVYSDMDDGTHGDEPWVYRP
jgi:ELWxxDGT repeat protein